MDIFCIVHELEDTQFLVDSSFNHEKDEYELNMKFWCESINGYAEMKLHWESDKEEDYKTTFEELKDINKAVEWKNKFEAKFAG